MHAIQGPRKWAAAIDLQLGQQSLETFSECAWVTVMEWTGNDADGENEAEVDRTRLVLTSARAGAPKRGTRARALI